MEQLVNYIRGLFNVIPNLQQECKYSRKLIKYIKERVHAEVETLNTYSTNYMLNKFRGMQANNNLFNLTCENCCFIFEPLLINSSVVGLSCGIKYDVKRNPIIINVGFIR